jgi:plasmid stabilization system protein ParE
VKKPYRVEWSATARRDLDEVITYIAVEDSIEAAEHVLEKIDGCSGTLDHMPFRCRVIPELRRLGIHQFREIIMGPHRMCFHVEGDKVVIDALLDGRRNLEELLVDRFVTGP